MSISFKITSLVEENTIKYYCNNILVATKEKYMDWFHSTVNGRLTRLRDKEKVAYKCNWNEAGLKELFGDIKMNIYTWCVDDGLFRDKKQPDFENFTPNYNHGWNGNGFSKVSIKEALVKFNNKQK